MRIATFSYIRFIFSIVVFCLGSIGLFFSLASPSENRSVKNTVWLVDNSLSMSVEDISDPVSKIERSRLSVARSLISSGITIIPGHHGIVSYARSAGVVSPLTPDLSALKQSATSIDLVMDNGGSDITAALTLIDTLYSGSDEPIDIILLSDGGDTSTSLPKELPFHLSLSIIGIGSPQGGPILLGYDAIGNRRYKIYQGKEVRVPYEDSSLTQIAGLMQSEVLRAESYDDIESIFRQLTENTRTEPLLTEGPYMKLFSIFLILLALIYHPYVRTR